MRQMVWLERDDPRWEEAWAGLEARFGDREARSPNSRERWQYMGSVIKELLGWDDPEGALLRLVSQFRHRDLGGQRVYWEHWHEGRAS